MDETVLTREEMRALADRALRQAFLERSAMKFANYDQRARTYERLADAADAVDAMLARDEHYSMWGEPGAGA